MKDQGYDLVSQIKAMINCEDLLAYFDFVFPLLGGQEIEGLCKLSAQSRKGSCINGISALFILDLPERNCQREADEHFTAGDWDGLPARLPGIAYAVPMPVLVVSPLSLVKQVDFSLHLEHYTEGYLTQKFFPVLTATARVQAGELTVWRKPPAPAGTTVEQIPPQPEGPSFVKWAKGIFSAKS